MRKPRRQIACNVFHLMSRSASLYGPLQHLGFVRIDGVDYDYVYTPAGEQVRLKHRGEPVEPCGVTLVLRRYYLEPTR